ncbi:MAG: ferrochelatase [Candidatus Delongbacteria bacterium]|nr:ferrochelatase [Candidatus Delongbacteria bacterium]MBN2833773.1 ferrochelatase [Candidatus Delongbacteria bacterium]
MRSIILIDMGGPQTISEYKFFLNNMFFDRHIIPAPKLIRFLLSKYITYKRLKKGWENYQLIGGTPLKNSMNSLLNKVETIIDNSKDKISIAYSYVTPRINEVLKENYDKGIRDFTLISLYPHQCYCTTSSVRYDIGSFLKNKARCTVKIFDNFYRNEFFIAFWIKMIKNEINSNSMISPHLLFSAHSIPESIISKFNDKYDYHINQSAQLIATKLGLKHSVSYQSQIKGQKWLEPTTSSTILNLKKNNIDEIIIIPISFLNENLETLYDIDLKLIQFAKNNGVKKISRAKITTSDENIIKMIMGFINDKI